MSSRDARIGFILGALTGAGLALVWAARPDRLTPILDRVQSTADTIETRVRDLDAFVGEMTSLARAQTQAMKDVAAHTTERFDEVADVLQKNLVDSAVELGAVVRGVGVSLDRVLHQRRIA